MDKLLLLIILFAFSITINAQSTGYKVVTKQTDIESLMIAPNNVEFEVEGSPYLTEEWKEAEIFTTKEQQANATLRYRIYDDIMEVQQTDGNYLLDKEIVRKIVFNDKVFAPYYLVNNMNKSYKFVYFQVLSEGDKTLLLKYKQIVEDVQKDNGYNSHNTTPKLILKKDLYVLNKGEKIAVKTLKKKKSILTLFGSKAKKIAQYAKKKKLKFTKKDDLILIFDYYNKLSV